MTQLVDDAGTRSFAYNTYGERESDSLVVDGDTHLIVETRDSFGRSTGFVYSKNGSVQHTVTTGYGTDGRISSAGFTHGGAVKQFGYEYLSGTNLLHKLTKPNNMTLTQTYEATRDLLTGMAYHRGSTLVAQREYTYDILGRPTARNTARNGQIVNDTFAHNTRSELTAATVNGADYEYAYDNIGNRQQATEGNDVTVYDANAFNQYTSISENGAAPFVPQFDADGNQTLIKTETGIWSAVYNAENRPVSFTNSESNTVVECAYDSMGRRTYKKVSVNGSITLHQRYIYRGYLQIACIDLTRSNHPALWFITWASTQSPRGLGGGLDKPRSEFAPQGRGGNGVPVSQPVATRPLAIRKDGSWFTYGWDLTKNICELYGPAGYPRTTYTYSPFGQATANGSLAQPIQWSSEMRDGELGMFSYTHRYLNMIHASWTSRDNIFRYHLYKYINNNSSYSFDYLGLLEVYHYTDINAVKKILEEGYKGDFLWTGEINSPAGGGNSWQKRNSHTIKLDIPDELVHNAENIPHNKHHAYYMEGLRIHKDQKKADAYRWKCVEKYMKSRPSNVFVVQRSLKKRVKWVVVKVNSINKSGIKILEVPGINANAASIPPLLREAGRNFNITKYVNIKTGLVGLSYAIAGYQLYTVRNSPKEITRVVYGWAGGYIGMKYGAAVAAGTAVVAGQLGPQIATPEEVLTVPIASFLGGAIGGLAGGILGSAVTEIVDNFTLTRGYEL